jgi:hypothetical protein
MLNILKGSQNAWNILLSFLLCDFKGMSPPSITSKGSQALQKGTKGE